MVDDRKPALTPQQLSDLLNKLDDVLAEAARLRGELTRRLARQRAGQRQKLSAVRRPRARKGR